MQFKKLLSEDDAVSPVIGVILMVAITVILAAVIASFVLGLGDTADEVQPTTSFEFDYQNNTGNNGDVLEITVADGDSIDTSNLWIRGDVFDDETESVDATFAELAEDGTFSGIDGVPDLDDNDVTLDDEDELSAGQGLEIDASDLGSPDGDMSSHDFDLVWDTGDDSATLDSSEGPDA